MTYNAFPPGGTYKDIGSLNPHLYIYKKQCARINENIQAIDWKGDWGRICLIENPIGLPPSTNPETTQLPI